MRDSTDFPDSRSLIEEARWAYSEIYYWHTAQGKRKFDEHFKTREEHIARRTMYIAFVEELVKPKKATIKDMLYVANDVLSGRNEWAYREKSEQGVTIGNWARRILDLLDEHRKRLEEQKKRLAAQEAAKSLQVFKNISKNGTIADGVRIEIPLLGNESWSLQGYLAYAENAYHDVSETNNIGGKVFLIQTNLERTHDNKSTYTFHSAKLLHVEIIAGEHNLVERIKKGELFVESVILGE